MMLVLSSVVECSVQKWLPGCETHTMFNGPFKWINTSNGRKERIERYMKRYVCIQLINCIYANIYIYIHICLYTYIFALTINKIEFLCCSIDRRISGLSLNYTESLSLKFHSRHILLPEVFPTLGRFEKKFQICCFCFETSRTSCMDLLVFSICDPSQLLN